MKKFPKKKSSKSRKKFVTVATALVVCDLHAKSRIREGGKRFGKNSGEDTRRHIHQYVCVIMPIDAANQLLSHPRRLHRAMVPSHRDRDDDGVEERGDKLQRGSSSGDRHLKLRTHDSEKEVARRYFLDSRPGLESLEARMRGIRSRDFQRLDSEKCVYLDYTGAMLAPSTLVRDHTSVLQTAILGNPHSVNAPSAVSSEHDHGARTAVLRMTRASSHDYTVIWTLNASGALKTVAEAYPFGPQGRILYAPDCHNSVVRASLSLPREFH